MVLDELKLSSDDSFFNEEHCVFLINKYRGFLLKQQYKDIKKEIPESNYQTICLDLEQSTAIDGTPCSSTLLKSTKEIPSISTISTPTIYLGGVYNGVTFVSKERFQYVGYNRWLPNIIYAAIGSDNYLYLKSNNAQFLHLESLQMTAIFDDVDEALELECNSSDTCDPWDKEYPLEVGLIPQLIELVVKELSGAIYKPEDSVNNAEDDLSNLASFLRQNAKSSLQKQIEG